MMVTGEGSLRVMVIVGMRSLRMMVTGEGESTYDGNGGRGVYL